MASAADITTVHSSARGPEPAARPNPVALEVAVLATGTRPAGTGGAAADGSQRDLFVEETSTVLVFRDGAVIRLAAAVADGQLVFLTNKQTKREVVCQVRRKRSVPTGHWYVELDFTEAMPDFWGVEFPAEAGPIDPAKMRVNRATVAAGKPAAPARIAPKAAPANAAKAEPLKTVRTNFEDVGASAFAGIPLNDEPLQEIVAQKKEEVRGDVGDRADLRGKSVALEAAGIELEEIVSASVAPRAGAADEIVRAGDAVPVEEEPRKTPEWAKAVTNAVLSGAARVEAQEEAAVSGEPAAAEVAPSRPAMSASSPDAAEESLPEPELDFTGGAGSKKATTEVATFAKAAPEKSANGLRIGLIAAAVIVLAAGAWYENWLPFLQRTKGSEASTTVQVARRFLKPAAEKKNDAAADAKKDGEAAKDADEDAPGASNATTVKKTRAEKSAEETVAAPKTDEPSIKDAAVAADAAVLGSVIVPAKLLKSVQAVYPPDAMRNYITGDVIMDAEVKADGHVGEMKVLQGPAALRDAAMDALKQYEYAPETKDGKAETSHVKVTVKFWFNP